MKCLIVLFFLPLCFVSSAQKKTDSLWEMWKNESIEDSVRFSAFYDLIFKGYMSYNPDSAFVLAQTMYDAAEKIGFKSRMVDAMKLMASSHYLKSEYSEAMGLNLETLEFAREINYKKGEADVLHNIGMIQYRQGNYSDGYLNIKSSLVLHEEIKDHAGTASNLTNIGNIYAEQGDYSKGLKYYKLGLNMAEKIGFKIGIASGLYNVGYVYDLQKNYNNALEYYEKSLVAFEDINHQQGLFYAYGAIGKILTRQGDYEQAFEYYNRGLAVSETIRSSFGKATFLRSIADLYVSQKDFNLAMDYYGQSLSLYQELADKRNISGTQIEIGTAQLKQGNTSIAISRCSTGLLIAEELNLIKEQAFACECLYDAHKLVGNGIKALEYHEKMITFNDSLKSEETSKKLQQMEFAKQVFADSLQKEEETLRMQMAHEQVLMKENRTRNLVAGAGIFILLIATGLWSRLRYIRRAKAVIEKEKDRSDNLLLNILPAEIAEELKTKGYADARDFEMVSILFTDFKEFTETAEKLSAQELVGEINTCFKAFDAICEKYQVEKIKTIGDSYMAAGGLPIPAKDSVRNTVRAALEMVDFMLERKSERKANGLIAFEMRAGIHTGPVVAGIVGVKKFQYDVWGDTVNTASRMESHGEVGRVNISQTTYELIKDDDLFSFETRGKLMVKGKGELQTYFVGAR